MNGFHLDARTLLALLVLASVIMAVILSFSAFGTKSRGMKAWVCSLGLLAGGWSLISLRGTVGPLVTVALADTLIVAGLCAEIAAFCSFKGRPYPRRLAAALPAYFLLLAFSGDNVIAYTTIGTAGIAFAMLALAVICARWGVGPAGLPMAVFYVLGALLLAARGLGIDGSAGAAGFFSPNHLTAAAFVTNFAMVLAGSTGFLEMHREQAQREIERMASTDGLTRLMNRQAFMEAATRDMARAVREKRPLAFLMADIDHFKRVNDAWGHLAGDRVLVAVAQAMKGALRAHDIVGRYGGEEFCALVMPSEAEQAVAAAERVRLAVAALSVPEIQGSPITISVGVAPWTPGDAADVMAMLERADQALYRAKNAGRNRVMLWEDAAAAAPALTARAFRRIA